MVSIPLTLRVHATECAFPMCDKPQALDIGTDGESGEMFVYRVSGEHRTLLDVGSAIEMWSRWLPAAWGVLSIAKRPTVGLHDDSNWSCVIGENASVHLTTPKCGPPITIAGSERLSDWAGGLPRESPLVWCSVSTDSPSKYRGSSDTTTGYTKSHRR